MTEEKHLIGRLISDAVIDSWRGGSGSDAGFDYRDVENKFFRALRSHGLGVVPVEPTEAMRIAAVNTTLPGVGEPPLYEKIWRAMITAATPTAGK